VVQRLDPRNEFRRQRNGGFECHPACGMSIRERPAVEAEPGIHVDQHPLPVDEIRDPRRAFAKVDGDRAVFAEPQELALDRRRRSERALICRRRSGRIVTRYKSHTYTTSC